MGWVSLWNCDCVAVDPVKMNEKRSYEPVMIGVQAHPQVDQHTAQLGNEIERGPRTCRTNGDLVNLF